MNSPTPARDQARCPRVDWSSPSPRNWLPIRLALAAALTVGSVTTGWGQVAAFPGAEGFGAFAKGGRGGDVYHVTNTAASGAGSFAYGVTTGVPAAGRTIVFDVSGYAHISGTVRITNNKITIAGQTAPGDGFGLKDGTFLVSGDDIVIRHMRFRDGNSADSINLDSNSQNSIFDHCDAMFSNDENMSTFGSPPENLTFQWGFNAWGMETHSCGGLWDMSHTTCSHSLWAHNHTRNPKARPGILEWINNVTFDWDIGFIMGDSTSNANWTANARGCYFIGPPGNTHAKAFTSPTVATNGRPNFTLFLENCLSDVDGDGVLNGTDKGYGIVEGSSYTNGQLPAPAAGDSRYYQAAAALPGSTPAIVIDPPLLAYKKILSNAGPLRLEYDPAKPLRDEVADLLITNVELQRRFHVNAVAKTNLPNGGFGNLNSTPPPTDSDQDGIPDYFEAAVTTGASGSTFWSSAVADHNVAVPNTGGVVSEPTFFPPSTPVGTATLDKYTHLEEYLHYLTIPHGLVAKNIAGTPSAIDIDLSKFTRGFSSGPVFTVANVVNGAVTQSGTGGKLVHFVPTVNAIGRAKFDFTVTDAAGSTWTQRFGILISASGAPRDLRWKGDGTANTWDGSAIEWRRASENPLSAPNTSFSTGDTALFDDNGSAVPNITLTGSLAPGSVTVDAASNFTFAGSGALIGAMSLVKSGAGTLTLSNTTANTFSGGVALNGGALTYTGGAGLGSGPIRLAGGTLTMPTSSTISGAISVLGAATINAPAGSNSLNGAFTGSAPLTIAGNSTVTIPGSLTGYTGAINIATSGTTLRLNQGAASGSAAIRFDLGTSATLNNRVGGAATVSIGSLAGGSGTKVQGSDQAGAVTDTYVVGGLNLDDTFAGSFRNGTNASPHTLALTKVGTGKLTLTGTSTYTGATTVSSGILEMNGTLGATAVSVSAGAVLMGHGAIGGPVSLANGAKLIPGNLSVADTIGLTGLTLVAGTTVPFDLSSNPATGNDRITLSGGALTVSGSPALLFNLTDDLLGAGTYPIITGGSTSSGTVNPVFATNLPSGTRQILNLNTATRGTVNLVVTGTAATLAWLGSPTTVWDTNNTVNWSGAPDGNNKFLPFDAVTFGDGGGSGTVTIAGGVSPRSLTVNNSTLPYTLGGGTISGSGSLIKSGPGTLTLAPTALVLSSTTTVGTQVTVATGSLAAGMNVTGSGILAGTTIASITNATTLVLSQAATAAATVNLNYFGNSYSGGTFLNGGTLALADDLANGYALGTGAVTFGNGTTLAMYDNTSGDNTASWSMVVPPGVNATLNADSRVVLSGALTGGGVLNLRVPYIRTNIIGDWSDFTGVINVSTDGDGGEFRYGTSYVYPGFPLAALVLPDKISMYFLGIVNGGTGTTIEIGELSGTSGARVSGGLASSGGRLFIYRIGGKGTDATFAGTINELDAAVTNTSFVKTGAGIWTLSGACSWNGNTVIEQGTLRIAGTLTSPQAIDVQAGATLALQSGTITTDAINLAAGATLSGKGSIVGDLNNDGTVTAGAGGTLNVDGNVVNNGVMRIANGTALSASKGFVNNGTLDLLTGVQGLPANLENNGIVIDSSTLGMTSAVKSGSTVTVTVLGHSGHSYQLQRTDSLVAPTWGNVAGSAGTGTTQSNGQPTPLVLTDSGGATGGQKYYRVVVSP